MVNKRIFYPLVSIGIAPERNKEGVVNIDNSNLRCYENNIQPKTITLNTVDVDYIVMKDGTKIDYNPPPSSPANDLVFTELSDSLVVDVNDVDDETKRSILMNGWMDPELFEHRQKNNSITSEEKPGYIFVVDSDEVKPDHIVEEKKINFREFL